MKYTSRAPIIINYTILANNTWEKAASGKQGVRKWLVKERDATPSNASYSQAGFDLDLSTATSPTHATYVTSTGVGYSMDNCDLPDVWVRGTAGKIIEVQYWG